MAKTQDIWTTKDGYHIQDVLALGRCVICGRLAQDERIKGNNGEYLPICDNSDCRGQILSVLAELAAA